MKRLFLLPLFLILAVFVSAKEIVIYHTSDVHGHFYPAPDRANNNRMWGGYAAMASVVNSEKRPHILLDSGDFSVGTIETKETKGLSAVKIMNAMRYAAATLGNHEFDLGEDHAVNNIIPAAAFPILSANTTDTRTDAPVKGTKAWQMFNVGGVKTAVIGISKKGDNKHIKFKNPLSTVKKLLPEIEKQKPDVIIVLIHGSAHKEAGSKEFVNTLLAEKLPNKIHIVLGGHAHKEIQNLYVHGTLFAEPGALGKKITRVIITVDDKTNNFLSAKSELIPLYTDTTGEDAKIKKTADSFKVAGVDEKIGSAREFLSHFPVFPGCDDAPLDNLISDVSFRYARGYGAQVFINNTGGIRDSLHAGDITMRDIIAIHPFDNRIMMIEVDGKFIKELIRHGIKKNRVLFNFSGLSASYTYKNNRVKNLFVYIDGKLVQNNTKYKIASNEYVIKGFTEGWQFGKIPAEDKELLGDRTIKDLIIETVKTRSPLTAPKSCRMKRNK
ncbi:2'(,)3'-cyclic-nucleotide 2'-phosphodiesterase/5'- or 3'-nucleotidase(,) 5'-nucleotidase family [Parelusimicrobium proximum]|uniref:bifunctional metallophosphatase/5'-nucleotidase n=1 Tax=Parelusimicrobium proximum TaxID=3228953 RepID=UPI003D186B48